MLPRPESFEQASEEEKEVSLTEEQKQGLEDMKDELLALHLPLHALVIKEKYNIPEGAVQEAVKEVITKHLVEGSGNIIDYVQDIQETFNLPEAVGLEAAKQGIKAQLSKEELGPALRIKELFHVPEETAHEIAEEEIRDLLSRNRVRIVVKIKEAFNLPEERTQEIGKQAALGWISGGGAAIATSIQEALHLPEDFFSSAEAKQAAEKGVAHLLSGGAINDARALQQEFNIPDDLSYVKELKSKDPQALSFQKVVEVFDISTTEKFADFYEAYKEYFYFLKREKEIWKLKPEDLEFIKRHNLLFFSEMHFLAEHIDYQYFESMGEEQKAKYLFQLLKESVPSWQDEEVFSSFEQGGQYFSYAKMFNYVGRENRHDVLFNFPQVVELARESELPPEQFYANILSQIKDDQALYGVDGISSYQYFNNIVTGINLDIEEVLKEAEKHRDIERLRQLAEGLSEKKDIFARWKNLKKYYELNELLKKTEILDELKELKAQNKPELYNFIETLAFHPNINMEKVFQFWRKPEEFLSIGEVHAPLWHERKKPSNYLEIPYLNLKAEQLRDALVEGDLDALQVFSPLEIEYEILEQEEFPKESLKQQVREALGKRSQGIKGKAKNPRKLFSELSKLFQGQDFNLRDYLKTEEIEISSDLQQNIQVLIHRPDIGLPLKGKKRKYRACLALKSEPEAIVAGNDTATCMPFGSGKNNVYTFNPNCGMFLVQRQTPDKTWPTIAQSVLTLDTNIQKEVPEVVEKVQQERTHLDQIVPEDFLKQATKFIACDNIEVAPSFQREPQKDRVLRTIYQDFFQQYFRQYKQSYPKLEDKLIIGKGYSDALTGLPQEKNTFLPTAPVGYSDKLGKTVLTLNLKETKAKAEVNPIVKRKVLPKEKPSAKELPLTDPPKGVNPLTFEDSLKVAYIEGKAYRDNEALMEYLSSLENTLIAKDIANIKNEQPNLSLKYEHPQTKKTEGYLIAYQGKYKNNDIIYIADIARDPESKLAGGKLINAFLKSYKKYYTEKEKPLPILAHFRKKTSLKILEKQIDRMSKKIGIKLQPKELGTEKVGPDTMHKIILEPETE